jgi:hypothetical protein
MSVVPKNLLTVTLPVVVVDHSASGAARESVVGLSVPTPVPNAAQKLMRAMIEKNEFQFEHLFGLKPRALPVRKHLPSSSARKGVGVGRWRSKSIVAKSFKGYKLIEEPDHMWFVQLTWLLEGGTRLEIDDGKLLRMIEGALSDGWGEGVEQFTHGPIIDATVDKSVGRRFSFTLTTLGGGKLWEY